MSLQKFTENADLIAFARDHSPVFTPDAVLTVEEISDGNINFVYRVKGADASVIVKQALPFIRIIGEGWPLSQDRIRIEAQSLQRAAHLCPDLVPQLYHYDAPRCALVMEDIGDHQNLREALLEARALPEVAGHLATYMARTLFFSSDFYLDTQQKKALVKEFINPDLCQSTERVFFDDPYCDHERNNVHPALQQAAQQLWQDEALKGEVARLKMRFLSEAQALLHGDLHTGSVFVTEQSSQVIDPEFGFVGPAGFDPGVLIANYLLSYCAHQQMSSSSDSYCLHLRQSVADIWNGFAAGFAQLMADETRDPTLQSAGYHRYYVQQLLADTLGFAGTEIIRRTIGIAQVAEWEALDNDAALGRAKGQALTLGQQLIMQREQLASIEAALALLDS